MKTKELCFSSELLPIYYLNGVQARKVQTHISFSFEQINRDGVR